MKKLFVISTLVLSTLFITGCAQKEVITKTDYIKKEHLNLSPRPIDLEEVTFKVILKDNKAYFAMDSVNYENMSINVQKMENYMREQNIILEKYKEYYEK